MLYVDSMPHLRLNRQKVALPTVDKTPALYSLVFINTNSTQSVVDAVVHPWLYHNNKFHQFYMDNMYHGTYFNRTFRQVMTTEREDVFKRVKERAGFLQTARTVESVNNRNVFVSLQFHNQFFFKLAQHAMTFKDRVHQYIELLKTQINDPRYSGYKKKTMLIDIDSWIEDRSAKSILAQGKNFNNPAYLFWFALRKMLDDFKTIGNIDIVFFSGNQSVRINPSLCDKSSFHLFQREISRISNNRLAMDENGDVADDAIRREEMVHNITGFVKTNFNFVGDSEEDDAEVEDVIHKRIDELADQEDIKELEGEELEDRLKEEIYNDEAVMKDIHSLVQRNKTGRSTSSLKRDQELREQQKKLKVENMTIEEIRNSLTSQVVIEKNDVSDKVTTTNKNITTIKYPNFEKAYNTGLMRKDTINILSSLNDKSIPVHIRNIEVEDSSDLLNYKETFTVDLEDGNRVRHRLKFDMPKFIDDKFMFLNGNKKIIIKQLFMKPVVKLGPSDVQVATNYKKLFIERYGAKMSSKTEKFKKAISTIAKGRNVTVRFGNNSSDNNAHRTTIEYDEIASTISYVRIGVAEFFFNQNELKTAMTAYNIKDPNKGLIVGIADGKDPIIVDYDTQQIQGMDMDIIDYIMTIDKGELIRNAFDEATAGKKFMYSRVSIMKNVIRKQVPLVLLLGYLEGLTTVMRKAGVQHSFSDTRPKVTENQGVVEFANGYLVYEKYPFENALLMNAFADIPTKGFDYEEFDGKDAYLSIFDTMFNARNVGNGFDNFYELMIDPITKEILEDLNYPTDFVNLMLYANKLLTDNAYQKENEMDIYRVRSNELVNGYLYQAISKAFERYRITANNNNPVKISIPQDTVIKNLLMAQNVEDYSILNPIVELEKSRAISPKGLVGLNLDSAYTQDKRSYDPSMMGVLAMSTSPDANVGVVRQLTLEPNIVSPRGYIDVKHDKLDELKDANLFSPAELLSPLGASRDDTIRTAMATKQSKHIIPIEKSSPVLVSNGVEQVMHYHLSDDFSVVAKDDGEVLEVDEKTGIIVIGYYDKAAKKAGSTEKVMKAHQAINIKPKVVKNGAGGFFLSIQLQSNLKVGQKFKKNDILAYDKKFFSDSKLDGVRFNIGSIQKVACMSSFSTYEDSTFITKKLSEDMAADIVMQKPVTIGKNANVDYIVNIGDEIKVGDELMRFEMSFEDDTLNKFLSNIGDELQESIKSLGKTPIKSKYSGVIEDIKIYSTVDLEELSPSLQKIVSKYYAGIDKTKKLLNKYDKSESSYKMGVLLNEPTDKVETRDGKVKGNEVGEGVLIEFYIKYRDIMGIGDKITFFTALKSIIGEVIPEGYEPRSTYRPQEEVSSFIAPGAVLARMTPSILQTMFLYKVLIELKRKLYEKATGNTWTPDVF